MVEREELNIDWRVLTRMETKTFVEGLESSWYSTSSSAQYWLRDVVPEPSNELQFMKGVQALRTIHSSPRKRRGINTSILASFATHTSEYSPHGEYQEEAHLLLEVIRHCRRRLSRLPVCSN